MATGTRLFVGNIPDNTKESDLDNVFSTYGEIINLELKSKSATEIDSKKFAFVTISASNYEVEACIKHFSNEDFKGQRLYVTRARESFLERLQRERVDAQKKVEEKNGAVPNPIKNPVIKLSEKLNPRKRRLDNESKGILPEPIKKNAQGKHNYQDQQPSEEHAIVIIDPKKQDADKKRMESMKKKREEFKAKKYIIKTGLTSIDKLQNKKVVFADDGEDITNSQLHNYETKHIQHKKKVLFDDKEENSDDDVNFEIKEQFEGKKGQKVLDLQSRYKSDKRFVLNERFLDEDESETEKDAEIKYNEQIDIEQTDEKMKQLNILQDVLGVTIKSKRLEPIHDNKKSKNKLGMLRFDPTQPEHMKFLALVEEKKQEPTKKSKKKKQKQQDEETKPQVQPEVIQKPVEVSKETFYKVSDTLKEAIAQPTTFSLRSLFGNKEEDDKKDSEQESEYIPLEVSKASKIKNPLDTGERNPFAYDSSDTEDEGKGNEVSQRETEKTEVKATWRENLFFTENDERLTDGLEFFCKPRETKVQKDRRELKSLMKKRIYNTERKNQNQMFKKKIGGRRKTVKKSYTKKSR